MMKRLLLILFLCSSLCAQSHNKPPLGAQINWSNPLSRGLVGCWLMNEGAGTRVNDLSGNRLHSTLYGASAWTPGATGSALSFDGSSGCYASAPLKLSLPFTFYVWLKLPTTTYGQCPVSLNEPTSLTRQFFLGTTPAAPAKWTFSTRYDATFKDATGPTPTTNWTNLVGVASSTTSRSLYVNGLLAGENTTDTTTPALTTIDFGRLGDSTPGYTAVQISNVLVFNRALSASEIASLYRDPYQIFRSEPVEYYVTAGAPPAVITRVQTIFMSGMPVWFVIAMVSTCVWDMRQLRKAA